MTVVGCADEFVAYWREAGAHLDLALARTRVTPTGRELPGTGKHLRGTLTCLVAQACGARLQTALPHAVAIEAIQAASLIHDDYVDGDTRRRGRPATWTLIGARRAVLLGDVLFADAIAQTARRGSDACRIVARAIAATARSAYQEPLTGAELDTARPPARDRHLYYRIVRGKTGALFAAAAALGALAATATPRQIRAAYAYGMRLGEAYQIADDVRDLNTAAVGPLAPPLRLALRRFLGAHETLHERTATERRQLLGLAREAMENVTAVRQARARAHLHSFADNRYTALLRIAPEILVALADRPRVQSSRSAVTTAEP